MRIQSFVLLLGTAVAAKGSSLRGEVVGPITKHELHYDFCVTFVQDVVQALAPELCYNATELVDQICEFDFVKSENPRDLMLHVESILTENKFGQQASCVAELESVFYSQSFPLKPCEALAPIIFDAYFFEDCSPTSSVTVAPGVCQLLKVLSDPEDSGQLVEEIPDYFERLYNNSDLVCAINAAEGFMDFIDMLNGNDGEESVTCVNFVQFVVQFLAPEQCSNVTGLVNQICDLDFDKTEKLNVLIKHLELVSTINKDGEFASCVAALERIIEDPHSVNLKLCYNLTPLIIETFFFDECNPSSSIAVSEGVCHEFEILSTSKDREIVIEEFPEFFRSLYNETDAECAITVAHSFIELIDLLITITRGENETCLKITDFAFQVFAPDNCTDGTVLVNQICNFNFDTTRDIYLFIEHLEKTFSINEVGEFASCVAELSNVVANPQSVALEKCFDFTPLILDTFFSGDCSPESSATVAPGFCLGLGILLDSEDPESLIEEIPKYFRELYKETDAACAIAGAEGFVSLFGIAEKEVDSCSKLGIALAQILAPSKCSNADDLVSQICNFNFETSKDIGLFMEHLEKTFSMNEVGEFAMCVAELRSVISNPQAIALEKCPDFTPLILDTFFSSDCSPSSSATVAPGFCTALGILWDSEDPESLIEEISKYYQGMYNETDAECAITATESLVILILNNEVDDSCLTFASALVQKLAPSNCSNVDALVSQICNFNFDNTFHLSLFMEHIENTLSANEAGEFATCVAELRQVITNPQAVTLEKCQNFTPLILNTFFSGDCSPASSLTVAPGFCSGLGILLGLEDPESLIEEIPSYFQRMYNETDAVCAIAAAEGFVTFIGILNT